MRLRAYRGQGANRRFEREVDKIVIFDQSTIVQTMSDIISPHNLD